MRLRCAATLEPLHTVTGSSVARIGVIANVHNADTCISKLLRRDAFYSMWRSRTVPCPRGSGNPACETVLLHHEQFKIPENLARFAVKAGMGGFVKKMGPAVVAFVAARRLHTDPVSVAALARLRRCGRHCQLHVCLTLTSWCLHCPAF